MTVVVLNTAHEPLHTVSVRHAVTMLWRGVARAVEEGPEMFGPVPRPKILIVLRYVRVAWKYAKRKPAGPTFEAGVKVTWRDHRDRASTFSFAGVLERDHGQCAYCGQPGADTVDHVLPRCQGGLSTWLNCVAACSPCNGTKGGLTPEEADMPLLWHPFVPTVYDLTWR